ncbi:MAG: hypothetical protein RL701_623 [Pseudomonadota bacterium]|jgi:hypothetical protein
MVLASRPPPPRVPPISHKGIRYEQIKVPENLGFDQSTGCLGAFEESTGKQLWAIKIYDNHIDPGLESDVQQVYFESMHLAADERHLIITNESEERFIVNIETHVVVQTP